MKTFRVSFLLLCLGMPGVGLSRAQAPSAAGPRLPTGAILARPGEKMPGDTLTAGEKEALLKQVDALRLQWLEQRRDALRRAAKAATAEERQQILADATNAQKAQVAENSALLAKVRETEKQRQEAQRATKPAIAK